MKPKYIRIFSDIHLDFDIPQKLKNFNPNEGIWSPTPMETDKETILILAGDIWHAKKPFSFMGFSWFEKISKQFHSVLVLLGNHDFWGGNLRNEYDSYQKFISIQKLNNVHLIQNSTIKFDGIKFLGGTLWTDFNGKDEKTFYSAETTMNDYKYIKNGLTFSKLKPSHIYDQFRTTLGYIKSNMIKDDENQKVWVLTHHAPSFKSIHPEYDDDSFFLMNGLYASNLEYLMEGESDIAVWVHGHCHHKQNYLIHNTKIISNPRGYRFENTGYREDILFNFNGEIVS